jgi:hypothetical protein
MVVTARMMSTLKAIQLLVNSVRGLDHGNWRQAYNAICVPTLTYGTPIWFRGQKKHVKALQRVQNSAIGIVMGAFCSVPREPLHQLAAILPVNIHLTKLTTQAAICLLSLPTNSPVLHRLGQPWCADQDSGVPLPYPTHACPPDSCIRRLALRVPVDCRIPPTFEHPPWRSCLPPANRFTVMQESLKGEARKTWIKELIKSHHSKKDQLLVYCRSMGPNPTQTLPMWTAVCTAF